MSSGGHHTPFGNLPTVLCLAIIHPYNPLAVVGYVGVGSREGYCHPRIVELLK